MGIDELMLFYYLFYGTVKKKTYYEGEGVGFWKGERPDFAIHRKGGTKISTMFHGRGADIGKYSLSKTNKK